MANILLDLRRQIAKNRRKDTYMSRYMPKAAPIPAVADGKMRLEPENLDDLEPEAEPVQSVTIIQNPSQEQIQSTEEKMEESGAMDELETEEKKMLAQEGTGTGNGPEPFQFTEYEWQKPLIQNEQKEPGTEAKQESTFTAASPVMEEYPKHGDFSSFEVKEISEESEIQSEGAQPQEVPAEEFQEEETVMPEIVIQSETLTESEPAPEPEPVSEPVPEPLPVLEPAPESVVVPEPVPVVEPVETETTKTVGSASETEPVTGETMAQKPAAETPQLTPEGNIPQAEEPSEDVVPEPVTEAAAEAVEPAEEDVQKTEDTQEEFLHGPKPFDFSAYQQPKADMISNGVKPFDFDQYRKNEQETKTEPEPAFAETVRESTVGEESKEDFLLKEIDEFRERAKRLQMLLDNRETEAEKLKNIVDERQEKADALQEKADELDQILQERQQEADGITAQVERQIDALIDKVSVKMDELEASMADQNEDGRRFSEQKAKELKETLGQIQEQLTTLKTELSDKVHSENVKCFRNISDVLKGTEEKIDAISELEDTVDEKIAPVKLLGISSIVVGVINFVAIIIMMIVSMISSGAIG